MYISKSINSNEIIFIIFILLLSLFIFSCDKNTPDSNNKNTTKTEIDLSTYSKEVSQQGLYHVYIKSKVNPLPMNKIHSWNLHIETADGNAIENAKVSVYGGMPAHKHGFPTKPEITGNLGHGNYVIDGIKFSMPGLWEIWLNITQAGKHDKVIFKINL